MVTVSKKTKVKENREICRLIFTPAGMLSETIEQAKAILNACSRILNFQDEINEDNMKRNTELSQNCQSISQKFSTRPVLLSEMDHKRIEMIFPWMPNEIGPTSSMIKMHVDRVSLFQNGEITRMNRIFAILRTFWISG